MVGLRRRDPLRPLLHGRVSRAWLDSFPPPLAPGRMNLATISPILFIAAAFTLATILDPIWSGMQRRQAKSVIDMMVGDGKHLFANHFVSKADVYFHNGYYPSIFQQAREEESHLNASAESHEGAGHGEHHDDHANETPEEHAKHAGK